MFATSIINQVAVTNIFTTAIVKQAPAIILFVTDFKKLLTANIKLTTAFILLPTEKIKLQTEFKTFQTTDNNLQTSTPNERKEYRKAAYNMVYIQLLLMAFSRTFRVNPKVMAYLQSTGINHATKYIPIRWQPFKKNP
ncbi:hypothetical protein [Polaribacter cellanae]|uniref:Uncharacterized protein n=1 Tax=Polaribacter cellanae TaxID=2818493 RepID=A0A975CMJ3_9FLAO|nr:hypothetical protein [Polaribacter cellanae]QTE21832.1 hypothetical protein J3359_13545 [Polaribacter cellanae]